MKYIKEPINAITHLTAAGMAFVGTLALIVIAVMKLSVWEVIAFSIFGLSMILLYLASGIYHMLLVPENGSGGLRNWITV